MTFNLAKGSTLASLAACATLFATLTFLMTELSSAAKAEERCVRLENWSARSDAINERVYIKPTGSRYLLEYTTSNEDGVYLFFATQPISDGDYRFRASIETGESPAVFEIHLDGAKDLESGQPLAFMVSERLGISIDRRVTVSGGRATLRIRSQPNFPARIWSFATDPTLCRID
jgi:hypothetical protein